MRFCLILFLLQLMYHVFYFLLKEEKEQKSYPTGMQLLEELKEVGIQEINFTTFHLEKIDPYIFREYVYRYEVFAGYSRKIALRKAFDKYKEEKFV